MGMRVIFLSEKTAALHIGGAYLGIIDGFERAVELEPSDDLFCEIAPAGNFLPLRFTFDQSFLVDPPPQIKLYYTENALAVFAGAFLHADQTMRVLWQRRFEKSLLTLCLQGAPQLSVDGEKGFHLVSLPDAFSECEAKPFENGFLLEGQGAFALISEEGKTVVLSEGSVLTTEPRLKAEIPFHDSVGHTAVCEWENGTLVSCAIRSSAPDEATFALALFESALIGADCTPFLSPELAQKADRLKEFLGGYVSVVLTSERDKIGLVYPRLEKSGEQNVFDVRYFRVELKENRISNIRPDKPKR